MKWKKMTPKDLAKQFYSMADVAANNVIDIIAQENCGHRPHHAYSNDGVYIYFSFRGEYEYPLLVPWDYVYNKDKILDYYKRFKELTKDADDSLEITYLAKDFSIQELETLKER
jgi:hypothetical protein